MSARLILKFDRLYKELDNLGGINKEKFIRSVLTDAQVILLNYVQQLAPKKTGSYAESWKKDNIRGNKASISTKQKQLFVILEYTGVEPHLRVRSDKPYVFQVESGETVFTFRINHPGWKNIPHVRPALARLRKEFRTIIGANMTRYSMMFDMSSRPFKSKVENLKKTKITGHKQKKAGNLNLRGQGSRR